MSKRRMNRMVALSVSALVLAAYVALCLSPVKESIGRQHPAAASLLSPPWFNFGAPYISGEVLEFRVGMSRQELEQVVRERYGRVAVLQGGCSDWRLPAYVSIGTPESADMLANSKTVCLWIDRQRLAVHLDLDSNTVSSIRLALVRNEVI
jgi:hypothetical protein